MSELYENFLQEHFVKYEKIIIGRSPDEKYYAQGKDGGQFFIRFANADRFGRLTQEFEILKQATSMGIATPRPVALGTLGSGGYMLVEWVNGKMLSQVMPGFEKGTQYKWGCAAGALLKRIHDIPLSGNVDEWRQCPYEKIKANIKTYPHYVNRFTHAEKKLVEYIEKNTHWLQNMPLSFLHGDYKMLNMMQVDSSLMVVDFNSFSYGVTWADVGRVVSKASGDYPFYKGLLNQYYGGEPSQDTVQRIIFYAALHRIEHYFNNLLFNRPMKSNEDFFDREMTSCL